MQRYFKLGAVVGAVAIISLMISYFIPMLTIAAFVIGMIGSAGLYLLNATLLEQALGLLAAISAPTVAVILAIRKVDETRGTMPDMSPSRRITHTIVLLVKTSILSLAAVPMVVALLNNVTYMLVLDQFRGVSLLASAPIALIGIYVVLYRGGSTFTSILKLLKAPITLTWVIAAGIVGVVGMYYLSRTGNSGSVSSIEWCSVPCWRIRSVSVRVIKNSCWLIR